MNARLVFNELGFHIPVTTVWTKTLCWPLYVLPNPVLTDPEILGQQLWRKIQIKVSQRLAIPWVKRAKNNHLGRATEHKWELVARKAIFQRKIVMRPQRADVILVNWEIKVVP